MTKLLVLVTLLVFGLSIVGYVLALETGSDLRQALLLLCVVGSGGTLFGLSGRRV